MAVSNKVSNICARKPFLPLFHSRNGTKKEVASKCNLLILRAESEI